MTLAAALALPAAAQAVTVSGTAMKDELGTRWQACDGTTANLSLAVNGTKVASTTCSAATSTFSFTGVTIPGAGAQLALWFDTAAAHGVLYTEAASTGANITGLTPTQDRVWIRSEQVADTVDQSLPGSWDSAKDADVPITTASGLDLDTGTELHIEGVEFAPQAPVNATSIHVASTGSFTPGAWAGNSVSVDGTGTGSCQYGPNIARPFCIDAGGTFTHNSSTFSYEADSGTFAVETGASYFILDFWGGLGSTAQLGTGPGQTLTVADHIEVRAHVSSDPWGADVAADWIYVDGYRWTGSEPERVRWDGTSPFTITAQTMSGGGAVELPGANVVLDSKDGRADFGPIEGSRLSPDWTLRSVTFRNTSYGRIDWGQTGTGMTAPYDSTGGDDQVVAVATGYDGSWALIKLPSASGDWGIIRYDDFGQVDADWDDGDANNTNDDGDAILKFNSGGADVPYAIESTGSEILVAGSAGGNWMVRYYDDEGRLDTGLNGTGVLSWSGTGTDDSIRGIVSDNVGLTLVGNTGNTGGPYAWSARTYNFTTGALQSNVTWTNGGTNAEVRAVCARHTWNSELYVVGRAGGTGAGDWAIRRLTADRTAWDTFNGAATYTWNPGGTEDEATTCTSDNTERVFVGGTTGTGLSDDWRVRAFNTDGVPDTTWGTSGIVSLGGAGDDNLTAIVADSDGRDNILLGGSDPANGGRMVLRRIDGDGVLDTSWGTNGEVYWNATASDESVRSLTRVGHNDFLVGVHIGTNSGDVGIRRYDYAGDLESGTVAGTVRYQLSHDWIERAGIHLTSDLVIGGTGDGPIVVDAESNDANIDIGGALVVKGSGRLRMSSTADLKVANDVTINGTIYPGSGKLTLYDQAYRSIVNVAATTQFHDLSIVAPEKTVSFESTDPIRVNGTFYVRGTSCSQLVRLDSFDNGTARWALDLTGGGVADVQYAHLFWANASPVAATATNSFDGGSNLGWTASGCGSAPLYGPNGLQVDGTYRARAVSNPSPVFSWYNRAGSNVDKADAEVWTSPTANQVALWRLDGTGADSAAGTWPLTNNAGSSFTTGRFGQALVSPGTYAGSDFGDLDLTGDYTIDGWVRTSLASTDPWADLIYKGNGAGTAINYGIGFDMGSGELCAEFTAVGGMAAACAPASTVGNGNWHHVAMVREGIRATLYVDGSQVATDWATGTITTGNWGGAFGLGVDGSLDDWRISNVAYPADAIAGFYRTGREHAAKVWDFDATDSAGTAIGSTVATGTRYNVTYGGAVGTLRLDGARYWVRGRTKTTPGALWSNWSSWDYFETAQSMSVSMPSGSTLSMAGGAGAIPGTDYTGTSTFQVTTTNVHGYTLSVTGPSDTWAMSDGLAGANHQIAGRGDHATPIAWPAGTSGYFGLSVLSASGGKDTARWGTGTVATQFGQLNWAWPGLTQPLVLHSSSGYSAGPDTVVTAIRANAQPSAAPKTFTTTLTFTAVPNV